jgi:hypothetical protein
MAWLTAAGAGVLGALVMTIMTDASRAMGLIDAHMSRYQGCIVTGRMDGPGPLLSGLALHLAIGAVLALGYAVLFELMGAAGWGRGAMIGLGHWVLAGLAFPLLDQMNRCVADGRIRGFGIMGRNYGPMMVVGLMAGHVVFGAIVGALYPVRGSWQNGVG